MQSNAAPPVRGAIDPAAPAPGGPLPAVPPAAAADQRRLTMARVMLGASVAVLVGSFLPWANSSGEETLGGFSWGPGKATAVVAILLGLYALQGFRKQDPRVRYHGWAIAAVVVGILVATGAGTLLDEIDSFTFGVADVEFGTGLLLTFAALCFAIWPLVVLRKDDQRRAPDGTYHAPLPPGVYYAQAPVAQAPVAQAPVAQAPVAQAPVAPANWHPDPTGRFELRYFDGTAWTEHVVRGGQQSIDPVVQAPPRDPTPAGYGGPHR
jgi:hypothetical protein